MNPLLKALLEGLGLPETATTEQGVSALAALKSQAAQAGQIAGLNAQIATLVDAARSDQVRVGGSRCFLEHRTGDPAGAKPFRASSIRSWTRPRLKARWPAMSSKTWRDIGKADLAQLKALVAATPANPVLAGKRQTDGKQPGQDAGELNQAELAVCAAMGMTPEQFKAGKQAQGLANG